MYRIIFCIDKIVYKCGFFKKITNYYIFYIKIFDEYIKITYFIYMKPTYNPKKKKRARTHGFLKRQATKGGRRVIARRRAKGRSKLSV